MVAFSFIFCLTIPLSPWLFRCLTVYLSLLFIWGSMRCDIFQTKRAYGVCVLKQIKIITFFIISFTINKNYLHFGFIFVWGTLARFSLVSSMNRKMLFSWYCLNEHIQNPIGFIQNVNSTLFGWAMISHLNAYSKIWKWMHYILWRSRLK